MYTDRALISDLECGTTEHYIIIKNVQRQNVIVYIIILSSSQELSQCLFENLSSHWRQISTTVCSECCDALYAMAQRSQDRVSYSP